MYETVEIDRIAESKREVDQANWLCTGRCRCSALLRGGRLVCLLLCPAPYWVARGALRLKAKRHKLKNVR